VHHIPSYYFRTGHPERVGRASSTHEVQIRGYVIIHDSLLHFITSKSHLESSNDRGQRSGAQRVRLRLYPGLLLLKFVTHKLDLITVQVLTDWPETRSNMGCICSTPYDDHATPEERRSNALAAAEARNKAFEQRGIQVSCARQNGHPFMTTDRSLQSTQNAKTASKVRDTYVDATKPRVTSGYQDRKSEQMARDWAT